MKIVIDPGHGGFDPGAVCGDLKEKDYTLSISRFLRDYLSEMEGVEVVLTRDKDSAFGKDLTFDSKNRADFVKNSSGDLCLSIHLNAGNGGGAETIYSIHANNTIKALSDRILENLKKIDIRKRSAYSRESTKQPNKDYYFMHRLTGNVPTIIVECLFIDNPYENVYLKTNDSLKNIAYQIAQSVKEIYSLKGVSIMHWSDEYIQKLKERGHIKDEHDPESYVTFGEMAAILCRVLGL